MDRFNGEGSLESQPSTCDQKKRPELRVGEGAMGGRDRVRSSSEGRGCHMPGWLWG